MIGKRINELRKQKGMSQEELANKLSVSSRAVVKWESGETEPSSSNLSALADIFGVTTDYLLGREGTPVSNNDKRNKNIRILMIVVLIALAIGVIVGLTFSTIAMAKEIKTVVDAIANNSSSIGQGPVGVNFPASELVQKTKDFAASQGVENLDTTDATFVQWQNALLRYYTLKGSQYWSNGYIIIDYVPMILLIVLNAGFLYPLTGSAIVVLVEKIKAKQKPRQR